MPELQGMPEIRMLKSPLLTGVQFGAAQREVLVRTESPRPSVRTASTERREWSSPASSTMRSPTP